MLFFVHHISLFFTVLIRSANIYVLVFPCKNRLIYSIVIVWLHIILHLQKLLPPWYQLDTGGLYDSDFGLNKGIQTLRTVPTSVYAIDVLTLCCNTAYCIPVLIYWINLSESWLVGKRQECPGVIYWNYVKFSMSILFLTQTRRRFRNTII